MKKTAGISLMLLIFLSLCLITFSLLSLSGATADTRLAQNSADRTTEYYAAVTTANQILGEIDTQLAAALQETLTDGTGEDGSQSSDAAGPGDSMAAYAEACGAISVSDAVLTWETSDLNASSVSEENSESSDPMVVGTLQYDVSVKEEQLLHVELSVVWPESDSDPLYQITCQQIVSTADWSADTSQNLYRTGSGD